jgi:predicted protein tyrosine phosphatase
MIEVHPRLWVGNDDDAEKVLGGVNLDTRKNLGTAWSMVSAAKEPYHRALVGYTGRGAPKEDKEYYHARRGRHLALNWVDVSDASWFRPMELYESFTHINAAQRMDIDCLVHCNQGVSRSPALVLGWLHMYGLGPWDLAFERAEEKFKTIYPPYDPTPGVREFIREALW